MKARLIDLLETSKAQNHRLMMECYEDCQGRPSASTEEAEAHIGLCLPCQAHQVNLAIYERQVNTASDRLFLSGYFVCQGREAENAEVAKQHSFECGRCQHYIRQAVVRERDEAFRKAHPVVETPASVVRPGW